MGVGVGLGEGDGLGFGFGDGVGSALGVDHGLSWSRFFLGRSALSSSLRLSFLSSFVPSFFLSLLFLAFFS